MKKSILIIGLGGVFLGLVLSWITYEGIHRTGSENFCVSCHEMRPMVNAYHDDIHGGKGKSGIKVSCVSCHLPQDNIFNYIFTKAKTGVAEVGIHFLGNPDAIDWHEKRNDREHFVYDGGCISCHSNFKTNENISKKGKQMHQHYTKLLDTDKQIGCASCHIEIGHKGLRSMLNYYKPEYEFYEGKLDKQKEDAEKKLDKQNIGWFQ